MIAYVFQNYPENFPLQVFISVCEAGGSDSEERMKCPPPFPSVL